MASTKRTSRNPISGFFSRRAKKSKGIMKSVWMFLAFVFGGGGFIAYPYAEEQIWPKVREEVKERIEEYRHNHSGINGEGTGEIRVYFTHPESPPHQPGDIAAMVAGYVDATQQTLDVAAFELDNQIIVEALVRAAGRGVKVRLVTETDYIGESGVHALRGAGVPVVDDQRPGSLMHNKFMVFDSKAVWMGSMNFTENCAYKNNNHGVYIADAKLAENYAVKFSWMFEQHKFGGAPSRTAVIPNPEITLADGTRVENYFSTHDHCADRITAVVASAKSSVHFMAFSFTHDGIGKTMVDRARTGVEVAGVFEKSQASGTYTEYGRLRSAKLPVYIDANPRNMHHKVIIIDKKIVVCGSFNFSESADKSNDENLLIIHNPTIAAAFEQEFDRVYGAARSANGP